MATKEARVTKVRAGAVRDLLAGAGRLHRVRARSPFNLFTVLRKPHDEVNLHSRFLHALLDHRDRGSGERENLRDFLHVVAQIEEFPIRGARVAREEGNVDLLVTSGGKAVVIENKIYAGDQDGQLFRYHRAISSDPRYDESAVHLCYLTLWGDKPDPRSIGDRGARLKLLSYLDDLPDWLRRCQMRAFDEPALRESIGQYIDLVRRLTGTDHENTYMTKLTTLLPRITSVPRHGSPLSDRRSAHPIAR